MKHSDREAVVVTGGSSGVGRAVAHAFARRGARVALLARGDKGLRDTADEVAHLGGQALTIPTDVADAKAVEAAAERTESVFGPIDVWINDAMATVFAEFVDIHPDEYRRATEVTYLGTVHGTMAALHRMVPRDHGTVVQVGSALAYRAIPLQSAYCGAKFAIRGFTDSVRTELLHNRSRVWISMVQLPAVNTPQFSWCRTKLPDHPQPVPPIFQPEVAADAIWWAAHHRRREVYCGGSAAAVILANKLVPAIADRYLARTGYSSQQIAGMLVAKGRPGNLFDPVPSLAATHGMFDDQAKTRSLQTWLTTHRGIAVGAVVGCAAVATGVWCGGRS
jgi:short-subunit dehydrogenase